MKVLLNHQRYVGTVNYVTQIYGFILYNTLQDDVTAEGMKAVQESIQNNTALVKLTIKCIETKFSHLAVPILQGVLDNSVLRSVMLKMGDKTDQVDRFIDQVRSERPRTRLIINIKGS